MAKKHGVTFQLQKTLVPTDSIIQIAWFQQPRTGDGLDALHVSWLAAARIWVNSTPLSLFHFAQLASRQFQRSNNVKNRYRMRLDKLTMVQPKKGYPKLRGRAADISGLYSTMVELWNTHMDTADERHRQIRLFLKLNSKLVDILDSFSPRYGYMAIPASQHEELLNAGLNMAQIHSQLHAYYESQDINIFNQTSKTHFSLHSLQLSCYVHPYLVYCFKGESTMHRVQTLWKSCLHGSKHWQAAKKAAYKERHLLWRQNRI